MAVASEHAVFGKVEVLYNGRPTPNLVFTNVTLKNESNSDLSNVELNCYFANGFVIQAGIASVVGSPNGLEFTRSYQARVSTIAAMPDDDKKRAFIAPLAARRDFLVPVWNRGASVQVNLVVQPPVAVPALIHVAADHLGVRLVQKKPAMQVWGEHVGNSLVTGLIVSALGVYVGAIILENPISTAYFGFILGATGTLLGAVVLKCLRMAARLLT